ncbi:MAG: ATP-binding protein [Sporomusaceae bacterium]|nr:ATP-binding protein [Sporomusaceae bacterium]
MLVIGFSYGAFASADFLFDRDLKARHEMVYSQNKNIAHSLATTVNRTLDEADSTLLFMKAAIEEAGRLTPSQEDLLKMMRQKGVFDQIAIADRDGNLIFSAAPLQRPINISNREHFLVHKQGQSGGVFLASPRLTEVSKNSVIFLSRRLNDATGKFNGIVSIGIDQRYLREIFYKMDLGPNNSIVLLRNDGTYLTRVPEAENLGHMNFFKHHPVLAAIKDGEKSGNYKAVDFQGVNRVGAFSALADYPAFLLVSIEEATILNGIKEKQNLYRTWAGSFFSLLIVAGLLVELLRYRQNKAEQALSIEHEKVRHCLSQMEQQKVEMEMARLDRLSLIGEMAASIGHEVRNPLTTVRGYLQLFQHKPEYMKQREQLGLMIEELDRANGIITEFLSLAKNKRLDFVRMPLQEIIRTLLPLLQADALRQGKVISLELDEATPLLLDKNEIRQLILNFVRNSLEAMETGGIVTIRLKQTADEVLLVVADQGKGIDPAVLKKLGTPFVTTKETGTGLGLVVCYRIAEHHQAKIEVQTNRKGTIFTVRFPSGDANQSAVATAL